MVANRFIVDPPSPGAWNMAVDESLLNDAVENGVATLRFYQWSEPTLSLGYFQRYDDRQQHEASRGCAVVRRQTGGGAILHDRELTYSLTLQENHPLARQTKQLYAAVHDAFIEALTPEIRGGESRCQLIRLNQESKVPPREEPFLCFHRRSPGDVLLQPASGKLDRDRPANRSTSSDSKILGSAQRRHRGAILQHGSLLVERSPAAPELAGLRDFTVGPNVAIEDLSNVLSAKLGKVLGITWLRANLPPDLESKAQDLANNKYLSPAWTKRR